MSYRNKTYVIFDGDCDYWAYAWMNGWKALHSVDFDFDDAHDLGSELTDRASETTVKRTLRTRFSSTKQVIVLIGEHTRYLFRFVLWELEVALSLDLPIIAVNLNGQRTLDKERCPPIIRDVYAVHVSYKRAIIKHALDNFPSEYAHRGLDSDSARHYGDDVYEALGIGAHAQLSPSPPARTPPRVDPRAPYTGVLQALARSAKLSGEGLGFSNIPGGQRPGNYSRLVDLALAAAKETPAELWGLDLLLRQPPQKR